MTQHFCWMLQPKSSSGEKLGLDRKIISEDLAVYLFREHTFCPNLWQQNLKFYAFQGKDHTTSICLVQS